MTQQSHMMDTPSVAPRTTSTTKNGKILIPSAILVHIHPIQLEQKAKKPRPLIILMTAISLKATPMYTEMESRRIVVNMKLSSGPLFIRALKDDRIRLKWRKDETKLLVFRVRLRQQLEGVREVENSGHLQGVAVAYYSRSLILRI